MSGEPKRYCPRCGLERLARTTNTVCRDCKFVLSPAEWELWKPKERKSE